VAQGEGDRQEERDRPDGPRVRAKGDGGLSTRNCHCGGGGLTTEEAAEETLGKALGVEVAGRWLAEPEFCGAEAHGEVDSEGVHERGGFGGLTSGVRASAAQRSESAARRG